MSEDATTETAAPADTAPVAEDAPNYEGMSLARSGVQATEDGQAPGVVVEPEAKTTETTKDTETTETDDERASRAGAELAGRKRTLVDDLRTTREENKQLKQDLEGERRLIDSWRPILQKLDGRPDLQQAVINGTVTVAQAEATKERDDSEELLSVAEDMGFYKTKSDGTPDYEQPDLARAEKYRARHQRWARNEAEPLVQPFAQTEQDRQVSARIEQAVNWAKKEGDADPDIVREELTAAARKNPGHVLDNDHGNLLYAKAVHRTVLKNKANGGGTTRTATTREPVERTFVPTEAPGGKGSGPKLTASEKALGEQYGLTDKDWNMAEQHAGVRRGYTRLTDD